MAEATSEVILAAGTVGTSKLLMLSGVGPRDHLQSLKVWLSLTPRHSLYGTVSIGIYTVTLCDHQS